MMSQAIDPDRKEGTERDQRQHSRRADPYLRVRFDSDDHVTANWSFGGLLIADYGGTLGPGALITISSMAVGEEPLSIVRINARVVRADPESGHLALTFLDMDEAAYAMLGRRYG